MANSHPVIIGQVMATVKRWGFAGFIHFLKESQQNNRGSFVVSSDLRVFVDGYFLYDFETG